MIASVSGTVAALSPEAAVVEVGGVGLLVQCTPATLSRLRVGQDARLATTLVVRETELTLYGFADADERDVFETLQSASGVGPRLAQAVLGVHSPDGVRRAVAAEDLAALTKVPGIGRKGAQRIVLDLKDRLAAPMSVPVAQGGNADADNGADANSDAGVGGGPSAVPDRPRVAVAEQVRLALLGLGYTAREAEDALTTVRASDNGLGDAGAVGDDQAPDTVALLLRRTLAALRPR
ncbi:Holliday junction branch migration protein RuvA [Frankia sp. Cas4]|uniref:Holliday junction branch migration protein RuvA n=1 Tax=Frankia sp. Cas4 TaxID=3073927 RepID=UPI002AD2E8E7|nr:Holliday junction branch migration protein RuvA [Frankia sp. Cas4]